MRPGRVPEQLPRLLEGAEQRRAARRLPQGHEVLGVRARRQLVRLLQRGGEAVQRAVRRARRAVSAGAGARRRQGRGPLRVAVERVDAGAVQRARHRPAVAGPPAAHLQRQRVRRRHDYQQRCPAPR